jgi:phosphohistidine phosphatase SixA
MTASRRPGRREILALALFGCAAWRCAAAQTPPSSLIAAMQKGGLVLFLRHAATVATQIDTGRLGDRAGQRNLSPEGIRQAREIGESLRALQVPLAEILASPVFRARDTGELAFGADRVRVTMDIVADDYAGGGVQKMVAETRQLLTTAPPDGQNRLLIGHRTPLQLVTGQPFTDSMLPEGAIAVFSPGGGAPRLVGTVTSAELAAAARGVRR